MIRILHNIKTTEQGKAIPDTTQNYDDIHTLYRPSLFSRLLPHLTMTMLNFVPTKESIKYADKANRSCLQVKAR